MSHYFVWKRRSNYIQQQTCKFQNDREIAKFQRFSLIFTRKVRCFWSVTYVSFRFFNVFHVLISFWGITYGALKFRRCFFDDFSTFVRISLILAGSDPKFNTVLMRSPNVFGIFTLQISRFFAEIYDFEQFSWAPVQDFSKSTLLLERYLCIFSIFQYFSGFDQLLEHYLWCFEISSMFFWWFFNFWTSFADLGWIWSKI